jgi:hypothetical protein
MFRQLTFGKMLSDSYKEQSSSSAPLVTMKHLMDIGAYYNPINLFLDDHVCLDTVIIVEPILDPLSAMVPCTSNPNKKTHVLFLPITFKHYTVIKSKLVMPDTVVCIGCDSHYGPNRRMLENTFTRPYQLFLEYPSEYVHNAPFRKMNGNGPGERLVYHHKFQPNTNETIYTKRVMKIIQYSKIDP